MYLIILILIIINFIYNISGLYYIIPFIICIINFALSTIKLIGDPNNLFLRIVQPISLCYILFIVFINFLILLSKIYI
jgi:hypothetical protein